MANGITTIMDFGDICDRWPDPTRPCHPKVIAKTGEIGNEVWIPTMYLDGKEPEQLTACIVYPDGHREMGLHLPRQDRFVVWRMTLEDTKTEGLGAIELTAQSGNQISIGDIYRFRIEKSLERKPNGDDNNG